MDNLTHTLTALLLARAGLDRLGRYSTPALLLAANVPDIDALSFFGGTAAYLAQHRTWSHSLVGAAVLGAGVGAAVWAWARRRPKGPPPVWALALAGALGGLSHSLLDWSTPYGIQLLWPFRRTWYALDWFPIVDFWLLLILLAGVAVPALFRLVTEEIGARPGEGGRRWSAWLAFAGLALLAAGRGLWHDDAAAQLDSRVYLNRAPLRAGAFPVPLNPLRWRGVVETDTTYELLEVTLAGPGRESERVRTLYKPPASPALSAALATDSAQRLLDWARFPYAEVNPADDGWHIELRDLRYTDDPRRGGVFVAIIEIDSRLAVRDERLELARRVEKSSP